MEGYAKIASLMGAHPEFAIFRRFRALNMQNMLYLQAEITHLESELRRVSYEDLGHPKRQNHPYDWWSLSQASDDSDQSQWELILRIREKLDLYNDRALKVAAVLQLAKSSNQDLRFFRSWYERPGMGAFPLLGLDRHTWNAENEQDLMALLPRKSQDSFSDWMMETVVPLYHRYIGQRFKCPVSDDLGDGLCEYDDAKLRKLTRAICTTIASTLPVCSVFIPYLITSIAYRLGIIVAMSACFSLALAFMTNARQIEIFAATSAFAAISVAYLANSTQYPQASP